MKTNILVLLAQLVMVAQALYAAQDDMFVFRETTSPAARVTIDASRLAENSIPREFFGKFSENVGYNVYGGVWAQELINPSLEPIRDMMRNGEWVPLDVTLLQRMSRQNLVKQEMLDRVAYCWIPWNGDISNYSLSIDAYNTSHSQQLTVKTVPPGALGVGIRQSIYLPAHRNTSYVLSCYVHPENGKSPVRLVAQVSRVQDPEDVFCTAPLVASRAPDEEGWQEYRAKLSVPPGAVETGIPLWLCLGLSQPGTVRIDQVTLFPEDHNEGFEPEMVSMLRDYGVTLLRFPGGNYVSGYHWKDDLTPISKRPSMPNPAWNQPDPHHVGTDEYMRLCRLLDAEPLICVNAGNGTPEEAADWVEYCNGSTTTTWGQVRARNGHPEPYNVKWWEVGNELWGRWQIGHCSPEEYAARYDAFVRAMRERDPSIRFIAIGHHEPGWNEGVLKNVKEPIEQFAVHLLMYNNPNASPVGSYISQVGYSHFFAEFFAREKARGKKHGHDMQLAITELFGVGADRNYQANGGAISEALFFTGSFNSAVRSGTDVSMITYSALANHGGGLRRDMGRTFPTPVFYARRALKPLMGARAAAFTVESPYTDVPDWKSYWMGPEPQRFPLIDVLPAVRDGKLYVVLLNRDPERGLPVDIANPGAELRGRNSRLFQITGDSIMAMNEPMFPERVKPTETTITWPVGSESLKLTLPPHSMSLIQPAD